MKPSRRRLIQLLILCMAATTLALLWGCTSTGGWGTSEDGRLFSHLSNGEVNRFLDTVKYDTDDTAYHYGLGRHFQRRGKHALAVKAFFQAVAIDPLNARAFNALGVSYDRMAKFDLAVQCYQWATVLSPEFASAYNNLGYSYILQGKPELALAPLRKATALQNANPLFRNNLALAVRQADANQPAAMAVRDDPALADKSDAAVALPLPEGPPRMAEDRTNDTAPAVDAPSRPESDPSAETARAVFAADLPENSITAIDTGMDGQQPAWVAPRIVIANGNGVNQMGRNLGRFFELNGFAIERLTNASHFGYPQTLIQYSDGQHQVALQLARLLTGGETTCNLIHQRREDGYVEVIAGQNIAGLNDLFNGRLTILVANGNGVKGAARALSDRLRAKGLIVASPVNADHFAHARSRIVYPEGCLANAKFVARTASENWSGLLVAGEKELKTIRVIIGSNFAM